MASRSTDEIPGHDTNHHDDGKRGDTKEAPGPRRKKRRLRGGSHHHHHEAACPIKLLATTTDEALRSEHGPGHWSREHCRTLRELLGLDHHGTNNNGDRIRWLVVSNFYIDFGYLLDEAPELLSVPTVLVVYGHAAGSLSPGAWAKTAPPGSVRVVRRDPSQPPRSADNPLPSSFPFGCHHTKLFLVGYASGRLRVVVHTSNLLEGDVHSKCQGACVEDFPRKADPDSCFETSDYEETLVSYLSSYGCHEPRQWDGDASSEACSLLDQVAKHDFSAARTVLVASVPGFHPPRGRTTPKWGYRALRHAILEHAVEEEVDKDNNNKDRTSGPIVCQFSSIGSLSERWLGALWQAWDVASLRRNGSGSGQAARNNNPYAKKPPPRPVPSSDPPRFELVYPTRGEIRRSVEGDAGGGSVPGRAKNVLKAFLRPLYRRWTPRPTVLVLDDDDDDDDDDSQDEEDGRNNDETTNGKAVAATNFTMGKGRNVPHIKTYYQVRPGAGGQEEEDSMEWFVLSSHNLSKAAWGEMQNGSRGETFKILNWELGVFVSPKTLGVDKLVPLSHALANGDPIEEEEDEVDDESSPPSSEGRKSVAVVPLPYPFRPDRYAPGDVPWTIDH